MRVTIGHSEVDFSAVLQLMDDSIREDLHAIAEGWTEQQFVDEYCRRHVARHGEHFRPD